MTYDNYSSCIKSCLDKCVIGHLNLDEESYVCVTNTQYNFCNSGIPNFFIIANVIIGLNIIMQIIACCNGGYKASWLSFFYSFIQSYFFAGYVTLLVCVDTKQIDNKLEILSFPILMFIMFPSFVVLAYSGIDIFYEGNEPDKEKLNAYIEKLIAIHQ